ncbi:hypothetical protein ACHAWF_000414 [Thalassiosira exigua]
MFNLAVAHPLHGSDENEDADADATVAAFAPFPRLPVATLKLIMFAWIVAALAASVANQSHRSFWLA